MREVNEFPHKVRQIEHVFIELPDSARLGAKLWMPADAEEHPVPAILEYLPYRKRDMTRGRDAANHPYLAGHGYACVRVDMRGSGESDGVLTDEYTEQELQDGVDVIEWIARQPWCDGNVGMMGISWGGFNSLQIAARRPAPLKAIVSCCASDNQYEDNMHYMGGCLLGDHLSEATVMFAFNSLPPDPQLVGDRWRDMWMERLKGSGLWLKTWLEHQRRDAFWRRGSVCEDYSAIQCPVLAIGGWADGYTNAVFRLMEHLQVPRQGLIGPWGHRYPNMGVPGPATGFLQEVLRWFDHWLKGQDTGVEHDPMLRVWLQDSVPPSASYEERPGRWVAEPSWPSPDIQERVYSFGYRHLMEGDAAGANLEETVNSPLSVGQFAGKWCSYSAVPDLPYDQREEDGGSLVFDTDPLEEDLEMLGNPVVDLEIASDKPVAQVALRLSDVLPDGRATRITYGLLNLTHRDSDEHPEPLQPGRFYKVWMRLNGLAQRIPAGHRLRLSLSSAYFPLVWAPPEQASLTVRTASSRLRLPERPRRGEGVIRDLGEAEGSPAPEVQRINPPRHAWRLVRDLVEDRSTLEVVNDQGSFRIPEIDLVVRRNTEEWYSFRDADFNSLRGVSYTERELRRDDWHISTTTRTELTSDAENFYIHARLDAYEDDRRIFSDNWDEKIPRHLV
ncbi:CocE/NonD family hydrolase [Chelativorans sp. YIM 93263]|uniref:CocE/NonD family hydrolase n=1 Tax=Chelativorans sp. YIM 93263 TaxID=2906648 RepID=UPI002378A48A|nr:CocE/NonD family hydrolase [Chelativorans sp. YIM 93263]